MLESPTSVIRLATHPLHHRIHAKKAGEAVPGVYASVLGVFTCLKPRER